MAAPTVFASASSNPGGTGTTIVVTLPSHAADDLLIILVENTGNTAWASNPAGWTRIDQRSVGTSSNGIVQTWLWKRATSGSETNPTCTLGATVTRAAAVWSVRGADLEGPFTLPEYGARGFATGTANPVRPPTVTTLAPEMLVLHGYGQRAATNAPDPTNYTQDQEVVISGTLVLNASQRTVTGQNTSLSNQDASPTSGARWAAGILCIPSPDYVYYRSGTQATANSTSVTGVVPSGTSSSDWRGNKDCILVTVEAAGTPTIAPQTPGDWTEITGQAGTTSGNGSTIRRYYTLYDGTVDPVFTRSTSGEISVQFTTYRNTDQTDPIGNTNTRQNASSTTSTCDALTRIASKSTVQATCIADGTPSYTAPSGWTERMDGNGIICSDQIYDASGSSASASYTLSVASPTFITLLEIKGVSSVSPSVSPSSSESPSLSPSASVSPSSSASASVSPSPSVSPSASESLSISPSASQSPSASESPSVSPSSSPSPSSSESASVSPSPSLSPSPSVSPSSSESPSVSPSSSISPSASESSSPSPSASLSPSASVSPSPSISPSASLSPSSSASPSPPPITVRGLNFRATSGFVTDGTDETYVISEDYPITRADVTFGYEGGIPPSNVFDRSTSIDPRLAGDHIFINSEGPFSFRVNVEPGIYNIRLALGDNDLSRVSRIAIKDDTTARLSLNGISTTAGNFADAEGTVYSAANWPTSNVAVACNISSGILRLAIAESGGSGVTAVAHLQFSLAGSPSASVSPSPSVSPSGSASLSPSPSASVSPSSSASPSVSPSASQSPSSSESPSVSPSASQSPSSSASPSISPSASVSPSPSESPSLSPSASTSPSSSESSSLSPSATVSPSSSASPSVSPSASVSPSPSESPSISPSASTSPSSSPSPSLSPSASQSPSASESPSLSPSASVSPSSSVSPSLSPSPSQSPSTSESPSVSPSSSESPSSSISPSVSPSSSVSPSPSESPSVSPSGSMSPSASESLSVSPSPSLSPSASESASISPSPSVSPSASESVSASSSESPSVSPSQSISATASPSSSVSMSMSVSVSPSLSPSASASPSASLPRGKVTAYFDVRRPTATFAARKALVRFAGRKPEVRFSVDD